MTEEDVVELADVTHTGSEGWSEKAVPPGPELVTEGYEPAKSVAISVGDVTVKLNHLCMGKIWIDGVEITRVRKVVIVAEVGDVPQVTIQRYVAPPKG